MRIKITIDEQFLAAVDATPGTNGRAAKIVALAVEALNARGIPADLPMQRGQYPRDQTGKLAPSIKAEDK
jgi:hypothetical protein